MSPTVSKILSYYNNENAGTRTNLMRILMSGALANTGKLLMLAIDQGFEHGPSRSFAMNSDAYDPNYYFKLAIEGGFSAFAAPLGVLEMGSWQYPGKIPLILKINSSNSTNAASLPDQAITGSVKDALRLGCCAIGFTLYPGAESFLNQIEEFAKLTAKAKEAGLVVVAWCYPRGNISKAGERAIDITAYGAHVAALLGAHIIKVKLPTEYLESAAIAPSFKEHNIKIATMSERVAHVVQSCFNGQRLVVFSGMELKDDQSLISDVHDIIEGCGSGSIIGRNCFQRPFAESIKLMNQITELYER